jgi:hypothetical protein
MSKAMNIKFYLVKPLSLLLGMSFGVQAQADAFLSGNLTADNGFYAFISTDDAVLGTQIASGDNWGSTYSFNNVNLVAGQNYYLHIEAIDWGQPEAFIGSFNLSNSEFTFANATQTLVTDTANWTASQGTVPNNTQAIQPWAVPVGVAVALAGNGGGPWGAHNAIDANAEWIWSSTYNGTALFSTQITATSSPVPLPPALLMFASGLVGMGFFRSKVKTA